MHSNFLESSNISLGHFFGFLDRMMDIILYGQWYLYLVDTWWCLAAIQSWLNSVYLSPYWWLIEYWMTAILVHTYLYYILIWFPLGTLKATNSNYWVGKRLPLITLKATNSNYRAGCDYLWLTLITFYYLNGFFMSFHYPHYLKWEIITYKGNGALQYP